MHVCTEQFFLFSCSQRLDWRSDYKLSYFPECSVIFWYLRNRFEVWFFAIAHLSLGYHKNQEQQEVILLGKAQSSPSDYHPFLGPTIVPDIYSHYCALHTDGNYSSAFLSPWQGQCLRLTHLCMLSSQSLAFWLLQWVSVEWVHGWIKSHHFQHHLPLILDMIMCKALHCAEMNTLNSVKKLQKFLLKIRVPKDWIGRTGCLGHFSTCRQFCNKQLQRDLRKRLVILSREPIIRLKYCMCAIRAKIPELIASCVRGQEQGRTFTGPDKEHSFIRTSEWGQGKIQESSNMLL